MKRTVVSVVLLAVTLAATFIPLSAAHADPPDSNTGDCHLRYSYTMLDVNGYGVYRSCASGNFGDPDWVKLFKADGTVSVQQPMVWDGVNPNSPIIPWGYGFKFGNLPPLIARIDFNWKTGEITTHDGLLSGMATEAWGNYAIYQKNGVVYAQYWANWPKDKKPTIERFVGDMPTGEQVIHAAVGLVVLDIVSNGISPVITGFNPK